jgi:hypothetical protein
MSSDREKRINVLNDGIGARLGAEDTIGATREVVGVGHAKPVFIPELDVVNAGSARVFVIIKYVVIVLHGVDVWPSGKSNAAVAISIDGWGWFFPGMGLDIMPGSAWLTPGLELDIMPGSTWLTPGIGLDIWPGSAWLTPGRVCASSLPSVVASGFPSAFSIDGDCASVRGVYTRSLTSGWLERRDEGVGCVLSRGILTGEFVSRMSVWTCLCWI